MCIVVSFLKAYLQTHKVSDIANILDNIFAIYRPFSGLKKIQSPHPIYLQYKILYIANIADNIKYRI